MRSRLILLLVCGVHSVLAPAGAAQPAAEGPSAADPHAALLAAEQYPSAAQCATCHAAQYEEWRFSSHAYASISPMFHKFEQRINELASGTVGYFCMRCHSGVGTAMGEPRELPLWEKPRVSREGVTCISCHRVTEPYGKVNGERRIEPGDIHQPVYGSIGGEGVAQVAADPRGFNVALEPGGFGLAMHRAGIRFEQLGKSEMCVSCHQVAVHPGIKLETVWDEYRASPARDQGTSCQDCHMSTRPGQASGYARGPAAVVNGRVVHPDRKRTNHAFVGPGYPITHPGIFPHHPEQERFTVEQWMAFDYRAGWGTPELEARVAKGEVEIRFPKPWDSPDERVEARLIVDDNLAKLEEKRELRRQLMEGSAKLEGPFLRGTPRPGRALDFSYLITNLNAGHNLPSGSLGAQPEVWLDVALIDPEGENVWESGYVDENGDMADQHSLAVRAGTLAHDDQLVNLQSKFLTSNVKGTDREMYLPVPFDPDPIPFIRPSAVPTSVLNHPPGIRMEKRSLPPLGSLEASYRVPASRLAKPGKYRLAARLRSRAEPIYFMRFVGATTDMERAMNEWMVSVHPITVELEVGAQGTAAAPSPVPHDEGVFRPDPGYEDRPYSAEAQRAIYGDKRPVETARPLVEWGRPLYDRGPFEPAGTWMGRLNPTAPHFMVYGDLRTAAAYNDDGVPGANGETHQATGAARLNLELDLKLTATERLHFFARPFDKDGQFLRYDLEGKNEGFEERFDFNLETLFFEGEVGPIVAGLTGRDNAIDLPFAVGLVPMLTQNGTWLLDAFTGAAFTLPAKSSRGLSISNLDLTFFAGFDRVTTPAVPDEDAVAMYGLAGFAEANRGYWEWGYAFVDSDLDGLSYHNATLAFSKRYGGVVSNSVRLIGNFGQEGGPGGLQTADGALLLVESSWIARREQTVLPYLNLFAGADRPQALARAAGTGGVLAATGINFESDGLTGYPTLDDTGHEAYGGALGFQNLFALDRQLVVEVAAVDRVGDREALGLDYALGVRYQQPVGTAWIVRFDALHGWRDRPPVPGGEDTFFGVRVEVRRKF